MKLNTENMKQEIENKLLQVAEGEVCPLETYIELKALRDLLDESIKGIQDEAIQEAEKYGKEPFSMSGVLVQVRAGAGRWSFNHIEKWNSIKASLKGVEDMAKQAFKLSEKGQSIVDDSGEVVEPGSYTSGKDTIFITKPKTEKS